MRYFHQLRLRYEHYKRFRSKEMNVLMFFRFVTLFRDGETRDEIIRILYFKNGGQRIRDARNFWNWSIQSTNRPLIDPCIRNLKQEREMERKNEKRCLLLLFLHRETGKRAFLGEKRGVDRFWIPKDSNAALLLSLILYHEYNVTCTYRYTCMLTTKCTIQTRRFRV